MSGIALGKMKPRIHVRVRKIPATTPKHCEVTLPEPEDATALVTEFVRASICLGDDDFLCDPTACLLPKGFLHMSQLNVVP